MRRDIRLGRRGESIMNENERMMGCGGLGQLCCVKRFWKEVRWYGDGDEGSLQDGKVQLV